MSVSPEARARLVPIAIGLAIAATVAAVVVVAAIRTRPIREAVRSYTEILVAANRQDVDAVRPLCSSRYLKNHRVAPAAEGGIVGLPRNIHPNFQAWRAGENVWICPTNRGGPIYQFVREGGTWRFDGPIGLLRNRNQVLRLEDESEMPSDAQIE